LKPAQIFAALALVIAAIAVAWHGRLVWRQAEAKRQGLHAPVKPAPVTPAAAEATPDTPQAVKYAEVANKNLFSKDRNPNVVLDPPKPAEVKKMPPLPVLYGVLGLPSGTRAIMAEKRGDPSRPVRAGDTVGEFKVVSLDIHRVTFDWDGQQISKPVDDLIDRSTAAPTPAASPAAAAPSPAAAPPPASGGLAPVASSNAAGSSASTNVTSPKIGKEVGAPGMSVRGCVAGDASPAGTVIDGYKKQVVSTPFGNQCSWIPAK
jgi:hypothetical protein